jgi:hypothetical protein
MRQRRKTGMAPTPPPRAAQDAPLVRGTLLWFLADGYPHPRLERQVVDQVGRVADMAGVKLDAVLHYLAEKGYIERVEDSIHGRTIVSWRATAVGVDVSHGLVEDPGVLVDHG